jgi:alpha-1,2-mannosyltransferase
LLLVAVWALCFNRAVRERFDFHHFHLDARYVWEHGQLNPDLDNAKPLKRRQLPFYLPAVSLLLAPVAFGGLKVAAGLWATMETLSLGVGLWLLSRWVGELRPGRRAGGMLGVAVAVSLYAVYEAARFNQLTLPVFAMLLLGYAALERGRDVRAGFWLGLAALVKLLPALLLVWLVLKRRWWAAGAMVATVAAVAIVPCLIVFGPRQTLVYHEQWWVHNVEGPPAQSMAEDEVEGEEQLAEHFVDRHNQSLPVVLSRLLSPTHPSRLSWQPVKLETATCVWIARGVLAALVAGLLWRTRRAWGRLGPAERRVEFAVYLLAMMVFAPLLRQYYLAWALPAVLLFVMMARGVVLTGRRRLGVAGVTVWLAGMALWAWEPARVCGAHWLTLTVMGVLLLWAVAGRRADDAVTEPVRRAGPA